MKRLAFLVVTLAACGGDLDPQWQLDHDRIVAVAADPPSIPAGGKSTLTGLISQKGSGTVEMTPEGALVTSPMSLASALAIENGAWTVTAPAEEQLAAARAELKLPDGAPVPLVIGVSYAQQTLVATKTVLLGATGANPTLDGVTINGAAAPAADLVVGKQVDVPLSVDVDIDHEDVNWLTSCGTMHDFDLPQAYLRVEPEDPVEGQLVLVVRDDAVAGVTWRIWSVRAE